MVERYRILDLVVDVERREIRRGNSAIEVEPRVFDVLVHLLRHRDRVVSKDELLDAVWQGRVVGDQSVYRAIRGARELFGSDVVIRTVYGKGYRFAAEVEEAEPEREDRAFEEPPSQRSFFPRRTKLIAAGLVLVAILALAALTLMPPGSPADRTVVIAPFVNSDAEADDAYFGNALAEEIAAQLGRVPDLRVSIDADGNARSDADRLVRGRWNSIDGRLLVHVELADHDSLLWSRNFEEPRSKADDLTSDIAAAVMRALDLRLENPAGEPLPVVSQASGSAYERFLRARHLWHQRDPDALEEARRLLEAAIRESPDFARAHEALASVYQVLPSWQDFDPERAEALAVSAAREALRLEPRLGEARAILARHAAGTGDWIEARALFEQAVAREPGSATIRHWYAQFLLTAGLLEPAIDQARIAVDLDPVSAMPHNVAAWALILAGRDEPAAAHASEAIRLGRPTAHLIGAWSAVREGRRTIAAERLERLPSPTEALGLCRQALLDRVSPAEVEQAVSTSTRSDQLARIYHLVCLAMVGRPKEGLALVSDRKPDIAFAVLWAPEFADLRRTDAFRARVQAVGLAAFRDRFAGPALLADNEAPAAE